MNSNFVNIVQTHSCVCQERSQMQMFPVPPPSIPQQPVNRHPHSRTKQYPSVPLLMVRAPTPPMWVYGVPRPLEQMHCYFSYSSGIAMSSSQSNHVQATIGPSPSSSVTSTFELKVSSIIASNPSEAMKSALVPERVTMTKTPETPSTSCSLGKTASTPDQFLEQFHELVKTALDGCKKAEALATCHQKRPCFKKIDSLCARLKQDLVKTDNVMSNINSQGLAWAVKDFIFVFTRIMNAWIIIKGYVHSKPEGLTSIQRELCPNFLEAFGRWHETTHELIQSLIKSFTNLNKLAKQQRGGCNIFSKVEDYKEDANQGSNEALDDIEEAAESTLNLSDGAYIRAGIYPNVTCPPPEFADNSPPPPFAGYKKPQQTKTPLVGDRGQTTDSAFASAASAVGYNRPEYNADPGAATSNVLRSECMTSSADRQFMENFHRKTSLECIDWVLDEVRAIEEGQYFYSINFAKNYFPDFHLIGSNMIDLRTVYRKHDAGRYAMTVELLDDLHQIVDTCKQYANASTAFDLWNPSEPMLQDLCTDTQRKEMENLPTMQTFIAKMERLFAAIRKERPME